MNADLAGARDRLERAVGLLEELGDREAAARSLAGLARVLQEEDRLEEAIKLNRRVVAGLPDGGADQAAALAALSHHLA